MATERRESFFRKSNPFTVLLISSLLLLKTLQDLREHTAIYRAQIKSSEFVLVGQAGTTEECFQQEADPSHFPLNVKALISFFPGLDPRNETYIEAINWWDPYADQMGLQFRPDIDGDDKVCGSTYHFAPNGQAVIDH